MKSSNIGIIGFGNMGQAIAKLLKAEYRVWVFDVDLAKTKGHDEIKVTASLEELVKSADVLILAVKPQNFSVLLPEIKLNIEDKLVISIAAGITTSFIENTLGNVRVIRTMPNMPCQIAKGITCLTKGEFANDDDVNFSKILFSHLGEVLIIKEGMMNAATAISGNGPAYVSHYLELGKKGEEFLKDFENVAQGLGFTPEEARCLTRTTFEGTKEFLKISKISAVDLKNRVASKGGSTEAALEVLHRGSSLKEAVAVGLKRADELSQRS